MKYRVLIEESAHEDLEAITIWLAQRSEPEARKWYWHVRDAIATLDTSSLRCALARENEAFEEEIRHLLHGRRRYVYRILFTVSESADRVLHIRHGAQEALEPTEET